MASKVQIFNRAILAAGYVGTISSPTEDSTPANLCNAVYDQVREELLRSGNWSFAKPEVALALSSQDAPDSWTYEYQYPNNCLSFLNIVNTADRTAKPPAHKKGRNALGEIVIWTDEQSALANIIIDVTDPNQMDALFRKVLALEIGKTIAFALGASKDVYDRLQKESVQAMLTADYNDSSESSVEDEPNPDWITARD